jgi:NADPH:quinone reductase-like Zn-dependent oxidoreductase
MSGATMQAAVFRAGAPEQIALEAVPVPVPGPGEVRVRVLATALNHIDPMAREHHAQSATAFWSGADIVGVVEALGPGVTAPALGTRVVGNPSLYPDTGEHTLTAEIIGYDRPGGLAEYALLPAQDTLELPAGFDPLLAAAAPLSHQTAWRGLVTRGGVQSGETVLITGASGGVGVAAIQIAQARGARVIAITTAAKRERVAALGVAAVYARDEGEPFAAIRAAHGAVDLAFDGVGAPYWPELLAALRDGGRLVTYGRTAGRGARLDVREVFWRQLSILGSSMGTRAEFRAVMAEVFSGRIVPLIDSVYPLEATGQAFARLAGESQVGKVVVRVAG